MWSSEGTAGTQRLALSVFKVDGAACTADRAASVLFGSSLIAFEERMSAPSTMSSQSATPYPNHRLAGRFALVTGASRGIGRAVAIRFAAEGATVAVNHFNDAAAAEETVALATAATANARLPVAPHLAVEANVADEAAVDAMVAESCANGGGSTFS